MACDGWRAGADETTDRLENRGSVIFNSFSFRSKQSRLARLDVFEPVEIKCGKGQPSIAGVLKDISQEGARITLFQPAQLPNLVEIKFQLLALNVQAHIRWRHNNDIGVHFEESINLDQMPLRLHRSRTDVVASYFKSNRAGPKS